MSPLEEKINESKSYFFSRIGKYFAGKIAAYGLASSLAFGSLGYCIGCGGDEEKPQEEADIGMLFSPDEPDKIVEDAEGYKISSNKIILSRSSKWWLFL